jgi:hypothetical protein
LGEAYPDGPATLKRGSELPVLVNGRRLAIPYESIAWVEITLAPQSDPPLGFKLR